MLFADLVIPTGVLLLVLAAGLIALAVFIGKAGSGNSNLGPYFDPFAMILMALVFVGGLVAGCAGIFSLLVPLFR